MIGTFCPFINENCKGNECVMWRNERCVFVSYMDKSLQMDEWDFPRTMSIRYSETERDEQDDESLEYIRDRTAEELAFEMLEFMKREFQLEEDHYIRIDSRLFWQSKGVNEYAASTELRIKMEKARILAQREARKELDERRKKRLQDEKQELPSLVSQLVDWARINGMKKVTYSDVDAFMLEKDIDLLKDTRRALYSMGNLKLKSTT